MNVEEAEKRRTHQLLDSETHCRNGGAFRWLKPRCAPWRCFGGKSALRLIALYPCPWVKECNPVEHPPRSMPNSPKKRGGGGGGVRQANAKEGRDEQRCNWKAATPATTKSNYLSHIRSSPIRLQPGVDHCQTGAASESLLYTPARSIRPANINKTRPEPVSVRDDIPWRLAVSQWGSRPRAWNFPCRPPPPHPGPLAK
jgi:hypothetical protein